jgi:hypothetical protein
LGEEADVLTCPRIEPEFLGVAVRSLVMVLAPSPGTSSIVVLRRRTCQWADVLSNEGPVIHARTRAHTQHTGVNSSDSDHNSEILS